MMIVIKKLTVMLPYDNNIFEVGKTVSGHSQIDDLDRYSRYGRVEEIKEKSLGRSKATYLIRFESGNSIELVDVPVRIEFAKGDTSE